ncbi:hypothetical protein EVAR_51918_1 [Eumeta japonica]|uniref:Mariner Mos1 transposase n=1 Tax=Eumeta variegata TaxID=151549 RepID=A0A4C1XI80_EUMVA|nr:hypothetical protein EVAR_51918_1 [Eumeta japonica]
MLNRILQLPDGAPNLNAEEHPSKTTLGRVAQQRQRPKKWFLARFATIDETRLYNSDPETKVQSMTWRRPSSSTPKTFKASLII